MALSSLDQDFKRILAMQGFTHRLDAKGGKRQQLGIKYAGLLNRSRSTQKMSRQNPQSMERMVILSGDLDLVIIQNSHKRMAPADRPSSRTIDVWLKVQLRH